MSRQSLYDHCYLEIVKGLLVSGFFGTYNIKIGWLSGPTNEIKDIFKKNVFPFLRISGFTVY